LEPHALLSQQYFFLYVFATFVCAVIQIEEGYNLEIVSYMSQMNLLQEITNIFDPLNMIFYRLI